MVPMQSATPMSPGEVSAPFTTLPQLEVMWCDLGGQQNTGGEAGRPIKASWRQKLESDLEHAQQRYKAKHPCDMLQIEVNIKKQRVEWVNYHDKPCNKLDYKELIL